MYKSNNKLSANILELPRYIEGYDLYNSTLLRELNKPGVTRVKYIITMYQYRPDLIAKDYYGDVNYEGLVMLQNNISLKDYTKGTEIELIPKNELDNIIKSL